MSPYWIALTVIAAVALIGLAIGLAIAFRRIQRVERRYHRLVDGASAEGLEEILLQHVGQIQITRQQTEHLAESVGAQYAAHVRAIQHLSLVHFNPYEEAGGQFSFALALADGEGSGAVLCSLHGRGNTRLYAKPIVNWASPVMLSDEERQAIALLRKDGPQKE
jgi:hypothetical protein